MRSQKRKACLILTCIILLQISVWVLPSGSLMFLLQAYFILFMIRYRKNMVCSILNAVYLYGSHYLLPQILFGTGITGSAMRSIFSGWLILYITKAKITI